MSEAHHRHGAYIGRHAASERLPRHRHAEPYVAVVLRGGYQEAGDEGRFAAQPGTVIVHGCWAAHLDRFGACGAEVLNLPTVAGLAPGVGTIDDPEAVARMAERDPLAAAAHLRDGLAVTLSARPTGPTCLQRRFAPIPISPWRRGRGG